MIELQRCSQVQPLPHAFGNCAGLFPGGPCRVQLVVLFGPLQSCLVGVIKVIGRHYPLETVVVRQEEGGPHLGSEVNCSREQKSGLTLYCQSLWPGPQAVITPPAPPWPRCSARHVTTAGTPDSRPGCRGCQRRRPRAVRPPCPTPGRRSRPDS